jgi:hypothetical protein
MTERLKESLLSVGKQKPPAGDMELQIRNLSKTYSNGVQALRDVTLTIP